MGEISTDNKKIFAFDDIAEIVKHCEEIQEDINISESTKRNERLYAYEDIRDLIKGVSE